MRELFGSRKAKAIAAGVAMLIVLGSVWGVTYSPLFAARQIAIEGATRLTRDEVLSLAGVGADTNVFHLNVEAVAATLETSPWVRDATVGVDLPTTLVISITEREPVLAASDGVALAEDGVVLPGASLDGLPALSGAEGASDEARSAALLLSSMTPSVRASVIGLSVGSGELSLDLATGTTVSLGRPGQEAEKAAALRALIEWAEAQGVVPVTLDVSVPTTPTAVLEGGETVSP
jgi:cell division protein FtsQ